MNRPECLDVRSLTVSHGQSPALHDLSVTVSPGEVVALLGPSGAGKSTLIHGVAGFLQPFSGEIWLDGRLVASERVMVPPERRHVAVVFQNYALWPHLSALDTVAYPARRRRESRDEARREALDLLDRLGIAHLAGRLPSEMSGGEQQRVGLARALARKASLFLLDEPTAHLDTHVRGVFLDELTSRLRASSAGVLYATHDAEEALGLADRLVLVDAGRIVQTGTPNQVYEEPVDRWVASLTGPASVLSAPVLSSQDGTATIAIAGVAITIRCPAPGPSTAKERHLLVRPGWARLGGDLPGELRNVWYRGPHSDYLIDTDAGTVLVRMPGRPHGRPGEAVAWSLLRTWVIDDRSHSPDTAEVGAGGPVSRASAPDQTDLAPH